MDDLTFLEKELLNLPKRNLYNKISSYYRLSGGRKRRRPLKTKISRAKFYFNCGILTMSRKMV